MVFKYFLPLGMLPFHFVNGITEVCCSSSAHSESLVVVQSLASIWLFVTPWTTCSLPGFPVLHHLLEFAQTHVHWVVDAFQPSHCLSPPSIPALNLSQHQSLYSNELAFCIRWPKHWSFSFSISPSSEYSGLISFRIDWLDLLAVQGNLQSLLQHHSSKGSILWCAQPSLWSNSYMQTWLSKQNSSSFTLWPAAHQTLVHFLLRVKKNSLTLSKPSRSTLS